MQDYSQIKTNTNNRGLKLRVSFLFGFFLLLILFAAAAYLWSKIYLPFTDDKKEKNFSIDAGESVALIGEKLEQQGLINSSFVFRMYVTFSGKGEKIQAGTFILDSATSIAQVVKQLTENSAAVNQIKVTFQEGRTIEQYSKILEQKFSDSFAEDFLTLAENYPDKARYEFLNDSKNSSLEGYLFPDTYNFKINSSPEELIEKLLKEFGQKFNSELRAEIARQKKTIFEIVIMASLIEGEVGRLSSASLSDSDLKKIQEERRLVASVFYNRLGIGQALQSDATLNYITKSGRRQASIDDLQIDNQYNTYKYRGLPPGPIGNPSLNSILAAVYPAQSDYFYFLAKPDGEAVFARTLEEHNANKAKYLQ